jgi:3-oxoacyl-[acyl-carrier protein] reductase
VLARRGHPVAVHYCAGKDRAEGVAAELEIESIVIGGDVASWHDVQSMEAETRDRLGPIEVVVNAAGVRCDGLLAGQGVGDWANVVQVNLIGTFHVIRACLPGMLAARRGSIVNLVSPAGLRGNPGQTAYSASKAGVIGLTRSLAHECGRRGVRVNALSPGFVESEMTSGMPDEWKARLIEMTPMRRAAVPADIAVALGLILDATYMTGQVISVDGGISA